MIKQQKTGTVLRYILGVLLAFGALNAFGGGYYAMKGAKDVPLELLEGSPFHSYFIPGLILFLFVGFPFLQASIACFIGHPYARLVVYVSIATLFIWLASEIIVIGFVSFMQPVTAIFGIILFVLARFLPYRY